MREVHSLQDDRALHGLHGFQTTVIRKSEEPEEVDLAHGVM